MSRTALVTGAGQGLGKEVVLRLGRRGYAVHVTDIDGALAARTAAETGADAWGSTLDVRDADACRAAAQQTVARTGSLDLWVNNAGDRKSTRLNSSH